MNYVASTALCTQMSLCTTEHLEKYFWFLGNVFNFSIFVAAAAAQTLVEILPRTKLHSTL